MQAAVGPYWIRAGSEIPPGVESEPLIFGSNILSSAQVLEQPALMWNHDAFLG